jgi:hypothetical protein
MTSTPGSAGRTDATMPRPPERTAARPRVPRFTRAERRVHRATATLMAVCVLTAGCLYLPFLAQLVGRRALMVTVHEWSGLLLPVPLLLGLASRALRADLRRLNRFGPHDRRWLRAALRRRGGRPAGKFNAGQKLYAGWLAGAVLVMLGTGLTMWFTLPQALGFARAGGTPIRPLGLRPRPRQGAPPPGPPGLCPPTARLGRPRGEAQAHQPVRRLRTRPVQGRSGGLGAAAPRKGRGAASICGSATRARPAPTHPHPGSKGGAPGGRDG